MFRYISNRAALCSLRSPAAGISSKRFQSSSKNTNTSQLLKSQLKVTQRKSKKPAFNSLSNENITAQKEAEKAGKITAAAPEAPAVKRKELKPKSDKRIKKDYTALPKVPSTSYLDPESVRIDALYAGFRPLAMDRLKTHLLPNKKWYAQSKFVDSIWSISAAGLEEFGGWDRFGSQEKDAIKPYNAPKNTKVKRAHYKDGQLVKLEAAVDEVTHRVNKILPEPPQKKLTLKKGRTKPRAVKLAKNLKKND